MKDVVYAIKINDLSHSGLRVLDVKIGRTSNINSTLAQYRRISRNINILNLWRPNSDLSIADCERGAHKIAEKYSYERESEKFVFLQESYNKFTENLNLLLKQISVEELQAKASSKNILFCTTRNGAKGKGKYIKDGFLILKGSLAVKKVAPSVKGKGADKTRQQLIEKEIMLEKKDHYIFQENYKANSPSRAAVIIVGSPSNGWKRWKNKDGVTLDKLKR